MELWEDPVGKFVTQFHLFSFDIFLRGCKLYENISTAACEQTLFWGLARERIRRVGYISTFLNF